ncbi:hypothetical protein GW17_00061315 [Ensete ventricosum]|nr:hypothetical protein GW17_00061315 [Ensete ventricosum]
MLGAPHADATASSLSRNRSPRWTVAALTFLPRFLAGPHCRSPRRTPAASFSSLCHSRLCRSSRPPLPSLTVGYYLLPPAPIADVAAVLLLRLLPWPVAVALSSNLLCFLWLFHPLLPLYIPRRPLPPPIGCRCPHHGHPLLPPPHHQPTLIFFPLHNRIYCSHLHPVVAT